MDSWRALAWVSLLTTPIAAMATVSGDWVRFNGTMPERAVTVSVASHIPGVLCRSVGGSHWGLGTVAPGSKSCRIPTGNGQFSNIAQFEVYVLKVPGIAPAKAAVVAGTPNLMRESRVVDGRFLAKARLTNGAMREIVADSTGLKTVVTSPDGQPMVTAYSFAPPADMPPLPQGTTFLGWLDKLNSELLATMSNLAPDATELTQYRDWEKSTPLSPYDVATGRAAVVRLWSKP